VPFARARYNRQTDEQALGTLPPCASLRDRATRLGHPAPGLQAEARLTRMNGRMVRWT